MIRRSSSTLDHAHHRAARGPRGGDLRAVRHYHRIGLLPEPERDGSGYRTFDAAAVVRLIRIHVLASAGVPLARVQELLDADPEAFAATVRDIDERLRAEVRRLQTTRRRLVRLTVSEHLALPDSVLRYLDRLRELGVQERYLDLERDAWIIIAAQVPDEVDAVIARKHAELDDPEMVRLYGLVSQAIDWQADDPRIVGIADVLERLFVRAVESGVADADPFDDRLAELLDAAAAGSSPVAVRIIAILEARGWKGWTRIERVPPDRLVALAERPAEERR